jgi:hypothetical protein
MRTSYNRDFSVLVIVAVITVTSILGTCSAPPFPILYENDPTAKTQGYRLFKGSTGEGVRFSFEYPVMWKRQNVIENSTLLIPDKYSYIRVGAVATSAKGGDFADAEELIERILDVPSKSPEFQILSRSYTPLGQTVGEEVIYSFRLQAVPYYLPPPILSNRLVVARDLVVDYRNSIYHVSLIVDAERYETVKEGFEHLIATFRFLE